MGSGCKTGRTVQAIPRIEDAKADDVRRQLQVGRSPAIFGGLADDWEAVREWTPEHLKSRYGQIAVDVCLHLPTQGAPYECLSQKHRASMLLAEFVEFLQNAPDGDPCYMAEKPVELFSGAADDLAFERFVPGGQDPSYTRLWLGSMGTRSGLHFDRFDNLLCQVYGRKRVCLASPRQVRFLYPYLDYIQKSQIDPDRPDLARFPKYARSQTLTGVLQPGDVLYIPRLWWHHICSEGVSISANHWYGRSASLGEQMGMLPMLPPKYTWRTFRDFVWLGLLKKPYVLRLFSEAPTGKYLYDQSIGFRLR